MVAIRSIEAIGGATPERAAVTAADSDPIDGATFKATMTPVKCHGAALLLLHACHQSSSGTATLRLVYYDKDDALVGISDALTANGTALQATIASNTRYLAPVVASIPYGAAKARIFVAALAISTHLDVFLRVYDEEPNA